ncbi:MAG: hypothetical protein ACLVKR_04785 [Lachnospiraceae bacterium]
MKLTERGYYILGIGGEEMKEDKQNILDLLLPALQATHEFVVSLEYDPCRELVYAKLAGGRPESPTWRWIRHVHDTERHQAGA